MKLDDVVVTELLHVVAHMALISRLSMSEKRQCPLKAPRVE